MVSLVLSVWGCFLLFHYYDSFMKDADGYEKKIGEVKQALCDLGRMHPGSVSLQKRERGAGYHYLSYTFQGKGHTLYVREGDVEQVREEVANYGEFRRLVNRWVELEIAFAKCRREEASGKSRGS